MQRPDPRVHLTFSIPSVCADRLRGGDADVGLIPVAELSRLGLDHLATLGIATQGAVRSILLVTRVPAGQIRTLAADRSSRTSAMLARILLEQKYGSVPEVHAAAPDVAAMLATADAALLIGDPALRHDPQSSPYNCLDLGSEWRAWTGLPMVFAVWAGAKRFINNELDSILRESYRYGMAHLEEICRHAEEAHGVPAGAAREYLTRNITFELGPAELEGLALFRRYADELDRRDALATLGVSPAQPPAAT